MYSSLDHQHLMIMTGLNREIVYFGPDFKMTNSSAGAWQLTVLQRVDLVNYVDMIRMTNSMTRMFCCLISTRLATWSPRFLLSSYTPVPLTWQGGNSTIPTKLIDTARRSRVITQSSTGIPDLGVEIWRISFIQLKLSSCEKHGVKPARRAIIFEEEPG